MKKLVILLSVLFFSNLESQTNSKQNPSSSLFAFSSSMNLEWNSQIGKSVMVIVSNNNLPNTPIDGQNYSAHYVFGSGTSCDNGFIIYKGVGNSAKITGLTVGTIYHFSIYEYNAGGKFASLTPQFFISDNSIIENTLIEKAEPLKTANATPVVCPALSGITCTLNGTTGSGYLGAPVGCNAGAFAGTNPWDGGSAAGFISWSFSAPVSKVTLKSGSVNTGDSGTNVLSGGAGGAGSVSGLVCLTSFAGMVINFFTGACCGDVAWTVNSTGSFTNITLNNTGGQSGWIAECPSSLTVAALPIELVSFSGNCSKSNAVDLKWKTISETQNSFFTIERSRDANTWQIISKVAGSGNTNIAHDYSFTDANPIHGTMYYHLKQTDVNNIFKYSETISVDNCGLSSSTEIILYPNPSSENEISIRANAKEINVGFYNSYGVEVATFNLLEGDNKVDISSLNNGIYFLKVMEGNVQISAQKLIIQN